MKDPLKKRILILISFFSLPGLGERLASIPGGLLFPVFSSSGLVNSAALVMDWRTEARLMYSPPNHSESPHAYLSSLGHSNGRLGINLGYQGSWQENSTISGGFAAGAFRFSRLALGFSARNSNLQNSTLWKTDLSAIYAFAHNIRIGATFFGLGTDQQLGMGLGFGIPQKRTLEFDLLMPINPKGKSISDQYSASLSVSSFFEKMGISSGIRFDRQQDGFSNPQSFSGFLATTVSLGRALNFTTLYQTNPQSFTFGLAWVWSPPAKDRIEYFKEQNRKMIWNRG